MITWPALEHAAQQAGWKRNGRTWRGAPCPSCGGGTRDTAWVGPGTTADFVAGCNGGCDGLEIARALVPDSAPSPVVRREPRTRAARAPATTSQGHQPSPELPSAAWRASEPVDDTPGARYLTTTRGVWKAGERFPASVRWLPAESARRVGVRPQLPIGADGCVVYRFGSPGEADTFAAQLEAVNAHDERVLFGAAGKRPAVAGSAFASGRRVFQAGGDVDRGVHLCEGPIDALALMRLARLGAVELAGGAVSGAQGTPGFTASACPGRGPVTVWRDRDTNGQGQRAAAQLAGELRRTGRRVMIHGAPWDGADLTDWARAVVEEREEREAIQHES